MGFIELLIQAVALSMDAFSVSICKGLATKNIKLRHGLICGAWFGGFQALMPLAGFWLASLFAQQIRAFDHWIAFGLLAIIGINMLREALSSDCDCEEHNADFGIRTMLMMAIATSIDAMAAGVSMAMVLTGTQIFMAVALIGGFTFAFCAVGVKIGNVFGNRFEKKAQILGGVILILLGLKILLEHLGVLPW